MPPSDFEQQVEHIKFEARLARGVLVITAVAMSLTLFVLELVAPGTRVLIIEAIVFVTAVAVGGLVVANRKTAEWLREASKRHQPPRG